MSIENLEEKINSIALSLNNAVKELKHNIIDINNKQYEWTKKNEILCNKNNELLEKEKKIAELEKEYIEKYNLLCIKEKQIEKEEEEGRKVSILKNIQVQLSQKTSECELLNKQLKLYKSRCELLNNLSNKFSVNIESLDAIIERMLNTKDEIIDLQPKKMELTNQELKNIDVSKEKSSEKEIEKINQKIEETVVENSDDVIQEESIEVDIFNYKGKQYYIDNNSGDIYAKLEDDEVGDIIGFRNEKGIVKFGLRKK